MTLRKLIVVGAALAAFAVAGAAMAQTSAQKAMIDTAKTQGVVGEQADGYLGFHTPSSDTGLQAAVTTTNAARRQLYTAGATEAGTTAEVAGARMFETHLMARISTGQYYRNAQGQWVQR